MITKGPIDYFDPLNYIEKLLVTKMAECSVRLERIRQTENTTFDLASSKAGNPEKSIKSLNNNDEQQTRAVYNATSFNWKFDADEFIKKSKILREIDCQNISNTSG